MQTKTRELHYFAKALLFAIPAVSIGIQLSTWIRFALGQDKNRADFFAYYEAANQLRTGQITAFYHQIFPPWFGFIHPAYEALFFVPLSFMAPLKAYVAWIVLCVAMVGIMLVVLWRDLNHLTSISPIVPVALTLAFFPVSYAIAQGQDSILLALLVVLSFSQVQSGNAYCAGLLLGVGVFRFQILLPIAAMFLVWKSWRLFGGVCTSAAGALVCSLALTGISGQIEYLKLLRLLAKPANQFVTQMPNIRGVLAEFAVVSHGAILVVSGACFVLLVLIGRKLPPSERFLFAISSGCLLSFHGYLHDLSLLLLPFLMVSDASVEREDYVGMVLLAMIIALPMATIWMGSIMSLWICSLIPVLLEFLLGFSVRPHQAGGRTPSRPRALCI